MLRNKSRLVTFDIDNFPKRFTRAATRTAGAIDTMPDTLFAEFRDAVAAYERNEEES